MKNPFLEDDHPPFPGFPKDMLTFLRQLAKNNTREWFTENKKRYEQSVKQPMEALLSDLAARLARNEPDISLDPKRAIYRIYRDVRFSPDKSPYKTHTAAAFTFKGYDRKTDAAFYFHISPKEAGIGGGHYAPPPDHLKNIRAAIDRDAGEFRDILAAKPFRALFGELQGDMLSRVPQGFDKEHPEADLLRRKQFLCWSAFEPERALAPSFTDMLEEHFLAMAPFVRWLTAHS